MNAEPRVLLITPPWFPPHQPSLAVATLKALLERDGLPTDALHAAHLFPPGQTDARMNGQYTSLFFSPLLYDDVSPEQAADVTVDTYLLAFSARPARRRVS